MFKKLGITVLAFFYICLGTLSVGVISKVEEVRAYEISKQANVNAFVNKIKGPAVRMGKKWGILPSQIMVQAAFESAWGTSALAVNNKNFFGIRDGSTGWRKFKDFDECLEFFCKNFYLTQLASYESIIKSGSADEIGRQLNVNYAPKFENPNYDSMFSNFYRNYNFAQYDKMAFSKGYKEYPDIAEVRGGKTSGFTYHKGGELKFPSGAPTDIEDDKIDPGVSVKSDGAEPAKESSSSAGGEGISSSGPWTPDEDAIPNMPKDRDFEDDVDKVDKLFMTKAELDSSELQGIRKWVQENDSGYDSALITGARRLLAFMGLMLTILPAIWLLAYCIDLWVQVGNSPAFNLVTFGKCRVDYSACTESWWFSKVRKKAGIKYFAIGDLLLWSGFLALIGVGLINGYIYVQLGNLSDFYGYIVGY